MRDGPSAGGTVGSRHAGGLGRPPRGVDAAGLDDVTEVETVGDLVDLDSLGRRLPGGWRVTADVLQFGEGGLCEGLVFRRSADDPSLTLRPARLDAPDGEVVLYERRTPRAERQPTGSADSLEEALRAAVNWTHARS